MRPSAHAPAVSARAAPPPGGRSALTPAAPARPEGSRHRQSPCLRGGCDGREGPTSFSRCLRGLRWAEGLDILTPVCEKGCEGLGISTSSPRSLRGCGAQRGPGIPSPSLRDLRVLPPVAEGVLASPSPVPQPHCGFINVCQQGTLNVPPGWWWIVESCPTGSRDSGSPWGKLALMVT